MRTRRWLLSLPLVLLAWPTCAQEAAWTGDWQLAGRDAQGFYAGPATVRALADGELEVRARVRPARREGMALVAAGGERELTFRGRLSGQRLSGQRPSSPGAAGAVEGAGGAALRGSYEARDGLLVGQVGAAREVLGRGEASSAAPPAQALAALEAARAGDWGRPYRVEAFPFLHRGTTVGRAAWATRYPPRPDLLEAGPEVVYRLDLPAPARVTAWVQGDGGGVDVDVHVLHSLRLLPDGSAPDSRARGDRVAEADLPAGPAYVVVDTFEGPARAGPYQLRIDAQPLDEWYARPVARGVTLRTRPYRQLFQAVHTGSVLEVDPAVPGVRVGALGGGGCQTPGARARAAGAVAALNAGFFASPGCRSVSLLKVEGQLLATNAVTRTAFGVDAQGRVHLERIEAGRDWPQMREAVGGVPRVVRGGQPVNEAPLEGNGGSFATARHPRSAVGITGGGKLLLCAVDGRTPAGAGMSLAELGQWLVWLGAQDALNLDGGGSTCLWVAGEPWEGVVNHPSDNGKPDHAGVRPCDSVVAVWAEPLDRAVTWLAAPGPELTLRVGEPLVGEVVGADPEGQTVRLRLEGPAGAALAETSPGQATLRWTPTQAGEVTLELVAEVAGSEPARRPVRVRVGP